MIPTWLDGSGGKKVMHLDGECPRSSPKVNEALTCTLLLFPDACPLSMVQTERKGTKRTREENKYISSFSGSSGPEPGKVQIRKKKRN